MDPSRADTGRSARRAGGSAPIRYALQEALGGWVLLAEGAHGLCALSLGDEPEVLLQDLHQRWPAAREHPGTDGFDQRIRHVLHLLENPCARLEVPVEVHGTPFRQRVWQALRAIPCGETRSYSEIAAQIGAPRAVRAVAGACAANPLAVVIPCHRVVRRDGTLAGYHWGIRYKSALLDAERSAFLSGPATGSIDPDRQRRP